MRWWLTTTGHATGVRSSHLRMKSNCSSGIRRVGSNALLLLLLWAERARTARRAFAAWDRTPSPGAMFTTRFMMIEMMAAGFRLGFWEILGQNGKIQEKIHELTLFLTK